MTKAFKADFDIVINYDNSFWDECIDYHRIMFWALPNIAIQINPKPREDDTE